MSDSAGPVGSPPAALGAWLDEAVKVPERDSSESALRQSVLVGLQRRRQRRARLVAAAAVMGTVLVSGAAVRAWLSPKPDEGIAFHVFPGNGLGQVGAYVAPTASVPLDLKFTEGSVVELEPGARARVAATTPRGATVLLETGRADVNVVHRKDAEWTIMAGPYSVRVHGTAFSVEFDPKSQLFELVMRSGVVSVEGPGISRSVEIRGAQRFVHRAGLGSDVAEPQPEPVSSARVEPGARLIAEPSMEPAVTAAQPSGTSGARPATGPVASSWESQVRRGQYAAVLRDAEARGLTGVLASAGASELMALANAARFSGRSELARDAYQAIRQRSSGTASSAAAAFLLGRLAEGSAPAAARRWYERYEQEAPNGSLVAEAMGRRLVLTQTVGSVGELEKLAQEYLRRFPDGSYSGVARKIVAP